VRPTAVSSAFPQLAVAMAQLWPWRSAEVEDKVKLNGVHVGSL